MQCGYVILWMMWWGSLLAMLHNRHGYSHQSAEEISCSHSVELMLLPISLLD